MPEEFVPSAEDEAFAKGLGIELSQEEKDRILAPLTEQERDVLRIRFGLDRGAPRSIDDVAKHFKLKREEIRAIEAAAMRKLRSPLLDAEAYSLLHSPFTDPET